MKQGTLYTILATTILVTSCSFFQPSTKTDQFNRNEDLIAASQTGAKPLFFDPDDPKTALVDPGSFKDSTECIVRDGLPNFFNKANTRHPLLIGYIGGSITRGDNMYRNQSAKFIQRMFPQITMKAINAGISGTGTDLAACRIRDQLLKFNPDLIFIEFAVNGAFRPGMEGMIRQILKYDPHIDICLLYTIQGEQWKDYANGTIPQNIRGLEEIAEHYGLPSIHMGMEASKQVSEGRILWKAGSGKDISKMIFSKDGIHPNKAGGDLYAESIARGMLKMKYQKISKKAHFFPAPLIVDNWEDAKMIEPKEAAIFTGNWKMLDPLSISKFHQYAPWFPYIMQAGEIGASFSFQFSGSMVGLFDIGGPEACQLSLTVDGRRMGFMPQINSLVLKAVNFPEGFAFLNRFNKYCNNRYRGQCEFIELGPGLHNVTFSISAEKADKSKILGSGHLDDITKNPGRYNQTKEWLGKILIRGNIVKPVSEINSGHH